MIEMINVEISKFLYIKIICYDNLNNTLKDHIRSMNYLNKQLFKCFLNIMMLSTHLISSGKSSEAKQLVYPLIFF